MKADGKTMADAMKARLDAATERAFYGLVNGPSTSIAASQPQEPFTLAKLESMIDSMPPRETWAASRLFERGKITTCKTPDENLTLIHPDDWPRIERRYRDSLDLEQRHNLLFGLSCTFIDADDCDDADTAEWRARQRKRIMDGLVGTITAAVDMQQVTRAWWRRPY